MDVCGPRKIVEVPGGTRDDETGRIDDGAGFWHRDVLVALFVVTSESTAVEEEAVVACETIAAWTDEIAWEHKCRHAADTAVGFHGWAEEVLDP